MSILLNQDPLMLKRLEDDLQKKALKCINDSGVSDAVSTGIFSLDDMENLTENAVTRQLVVGVGYEMSAPLELESNAKLSPAPGRSGSAKMVGYYFGVILAVPVGECCENRYDAMSLLTALRFGINGSIIDDDPAARCWTFQREKAEHEASSSSLLYYSQTWMVALPLVRTITS